MLIKNIYDKGDFFQMSQWQWSGIVCMLPAAHLSFQNTLIFPWQNGTIVGPQKEGVHQGQKSRVIRRNSTDIVRHFLIT